MYTDKYNTIDKILFYIKFFLRNFHLIESHEQQQNNYFIEKFCR